MTKSTLKESYPETLDISLAVIEITDEKNTRTIDYLEHNLAV